MSALKSIRSMSHKSWLQIIILENLGLSKRKRSDIIYKLDLRPTIFILIYISNENHKENCILIPTKSVFYVRSGWIRWRKFDYMMDRETPNIYWLQDSEPVPIRTHTLPVQVFSPKNDFYVEEKAWQMACSQMQSCKTHVRILNIGILEYSKRHQAWRLRDSIELQSASNWTWCALVGLTQLLIRFR